MPARVRCVVGTREQRTHCRKAKRDVYAIGSRAQIHVKRAVSREIGRHFVYYGPLRLYYWHIFRVNQIDGVDNSRGGKRRETRLPLRVFSLWTPTWRNLCTFYRRRREYALGKIWCAAAEGLDAILRLRARTAGKIIWQHPMGGLLRGNLKVSYISGRTHSFRRKFSIFNSHLSTTITESRVLVFSACDLSPRIILAKIKSDLQEDPSDTSPR